jgi:hypothetical protein
MTEMMTLVCVSHLSLQNGGFLDYYPLCLDHPQSWLGLQLLVNSSVPTKLQKQINKATPSFFVCKRFAARKKIVSLPNFTVSCTYE